MALSPANNTVGEWGVIEGAIPWIIDSNNSLVGKYTNASGRPGTLESELARHIKNETSGERTPLLDQWFIHEVYFACSIHSFHDKQVGHLCNLKWAINRSRELQRQTRYRVQALSLDGRFRNYYQRRKQKDERRLECSVVGVHLLQNLSSAFEWIADIRINLEEQHLKRKVSFLIGKGAV